MRLGARFGRQDAMGDVMREAEMKERKEAQADLGGVPLLLNEKMSGGKLRSQWLRIRRVSSSKSSDDASSDQDSKESQSYPWRPRFWSGAAWRGMGSAVLIVFLTAAAGGVLGLSNGSPINVWHYKGLDIQPEVWLSMLATIMNSVSMYALTEGAAIHFWRQALRGTNLGQFHDYYESQWAFRSLKYFRRGRMNPVAIASVLGFISMLRGPLYQRATRVNDHYVTTKIGQFDMDMAQIIPRHYLALEDGSTQISKSMSTILEGFLRNVPISYPNMSCGETCTTKLMGFGFDVECTNSSIAAQGEDIQSFASNYTSGDTLPVFNVVPFVHGVTAPDNRSYFAEHDSAALRGSMDVVSLYKTVPDCTSNLGLSSCSFRPAVVEYGVTIQDSGVGLSTEHYQDDRIITRLNTVNPVYDNGAPIDIRFDTLPTWALFVAHIFSDTFSLSPDGDFAPLNAAGETLGYFLAKFIDQDPSGNMNISCATTFYDPSQYIADQMRELAFRTSIALAAVTDPSLIFTNTSQATAMAPLITNWTQSVTVQGSTWAVVYKITVPYVLLATLISLLPVPALLYLYYGWWELGRKVSFSPLEMARMFEPPMLSGVDANMTAEQIAKGVRGMQVRYGAVDERGEALKLRLAEESAVRRPDLGEVFQ